ncbi:MAG: glycosyltransferase family protein [Synergistaceae bacterium]|nr:glycosyltransferase family protein [Synergistaceae bacterium]
MRTVGIVQARMTSTRLPGKVLMKALGKPLLQYELERLKRVPSLDELVVATTVNAADDPVAVLCDQMGIASYRGSELDVLSRYHEAATLYGAEAVVRFTADCPLIDPALSDSVIRRFLEGAGDLDYCSLNVSDAYPRGMDTEVFSAASLTESFNEGTTEPDREHVTYFIRRYPERYRILRLRCEKNRSVYRLTVDTPDDLALVSGIIETLYPQKPDFTIDDIIALLEAEPELAKINGEVKQKGV